MALKIGLGTAAIGRPEYINIRKDKKSSFSLETFKREGMEMINTAYDLGIRYFDTAPGYGMAEQLLMEWSRGKTDKNLEIATKWGYTYTADFQLEAKVHEVKEHSLEKLNEQWKQSKSLLPLLTSYQIHSATFETGVLENDDVINRLAELKNEHGLLIGLTASGANQIEVIKKSLDIEVNGELLFDVFQVTYNIFDQSIATLSNHFDSNDRRLVIKEALANGRVFPNNRYHHYQSAHDKLGELAKKYDVGIDAIALRYCIDSIPSFIVLSGASLKAHLIDNLKAETFQLSEKDIGALKEFTIPPQQYWDERKKLKWN
ncbi:MAG: aldo/keto reductase [Saprospiraceae bacterium]|nr:aldo/keto reductase [Saprospiraceae bacterium]